MNIIIEDTHTLVSEIDNTKDGIQKFSNDWIIINDRYFKCYLDISIFARAAIYLEYCMLLDWKSFLFSNIEKRERENMALFNYYY